jgi:hypothetical protein
MADRADTGPDGIRGFMRERTEGLGGAARDASSLVSGLLAVGRGGRDILRGLVRAEIERALPRLGLATTGEIDAVRRELDAMSARIGTLEASVGAQQPSSRASTTSGRGSTHRTTTRPASRTRRSSGRVTSRPTPSPDGPGRPDGTDEEPDEA